MGRAKSSEVGDGVDVGSVIRGWPAGMSPNSCCDIAASRWVRPRVRLLAMLFWVVLSCVRLRRGPVASVCPRSGRMRMIGILDVAPLCVYKRYASVGRGYNRLERMRMSLKRVEARRSSESQGSPCVCAGDVSEGGTPESGTPSPSPSPTAMSTIQFWPHRAATVL